MVWTWKRKIVRSIVAVADMHVGSRYSVCPDNYVSPKDGVKISSQMNSEQKQLLEYWRHFCKVADEFKCDTVWVVGDTIAGTNPLEKGIGLMTSDLDEQVDMACLLLTPLVKKRKLQIWSGTSYHDSSDVRTAKVIAERFNGDFMGAISNVKLEPSEKIANVAHETTEATVYPETAISRDMMFLKEAEALGKLHKTNLIVRAHRHMWCEVHKYDLHYLSLPGWQLFVPYKKAIRWYFKFQPDIGGAIILMDDKYRIDMLHFLYPLPHVVDKIR